MMHQALLRVKTLLDEQRITPADNTMLCGLSGGADSVALVMMLQQLGYNVVAMHCNFQLRDEESERDENFCRNFCRKLDIELLTKRFDTQNIAAAQKESIEMAARRLRYEWFATCAEKLQATICVAHHADDNVETMLLNLIRGAGLHGLSGMRFRNEMGVVRPLLCLTRQDIIQYLDEEQQDYVTDSSNADTHYRRNKIRHQLLPLLRTINPSIDRTLTETMTRLREDEAFIESIDDERSQRRRKLQHQGFSMTQILQIEQARNGAWTTAGEMMLTKSQERLISGKIPPHIAPTTIVAQPTQACNVTNLRDRNTAVIDTKAISGNLYVRSLQTGDRFRPFGMHGTKLVSDFLTDRKRSRLEKLAALCLCDDNGILWLVGETIDHRAAVNAQTKEVVVITREDIKKLLGKENNHNAK